MAEMKEEVEPLPLVPAMWIGFSWSKSDGYTCISVLHLFGPQWPDAHLISYSSNPLSHLRECLLVPSRSELLDGLDNGEVALKRVERCDGGFVVSRTIVRADHPLLERQPSCTRSTESYSLHEMGENWRCRGSKSLN